MAVNIFCEFERWNRKQIGVSFSASYPSHPLSLLFFPSLDSFFHNVFLGQLFRTCLPKSEKEIIKWFCKLKWSKPRRMIPIEKNNLFFKYFGFFFFKKYFLNIIHTQTLQIYRVINFFFKYYKLIHLFLYCIVISFECWSVCFCFSIFFWSAMWCRRVRLYCSPTTTILFITSFQTR